MTEDKLFLTYNQQMKHLRNHKKIDCHDVDHKRILVRTGYFNLINGYKNPLYVVKLWKANIFIYAEPVLTIFTK